MTHRFLHWLESGESLLLDGGLATELEAQGHDLNNTLWSASLLHREPEAIIAAHMAYLEAGAQCIISASYQASRAGLMTLGISPGEADRLIAGTDCGMVPRSRRAAEGKMNALAAGAALVNRELWA